MILFFPYREWIWNFAIVLLDSVEGGVVYRAPQLSKRGTPCRQEPKQVQLISLF